MVVYLLALVLFLMGVFALYFGRAVTGWLVLGIILIVLGIVVALLKASGDPDTEALWPALTLLFSMH